MTPNHHCQHQQSLEVKWKQFSVEETSLKSPPFTLALEMFQVICTSTG